MGRLEFVIGVLIGAAFVALVDLVHACLRMPEVPVLPVLGCAFLVSTGALACTSVLLLLLHRAVWRIIPPKVRFIATALEGLGLGALALLAEDMPSIPRRYRIASTVAFAVVGAVVVPLGKRFPRLVCVLGVFAGGLLFAWLETLSGRWYPLLRFVIDFVLLSACGFSWEAFRSRKVPPRRVLGVLAFFAVVAPLGVWFVPPLRGVVFEYGAHARRLMTWASAPHLEGSRLGDVVCENGRAPPAPVSKHSTLSGAAERADVLFLSFDAMRWDHADAVGEVWRELGPKVSFSRIVSPAPRTENSFAATLRGVPARLVTTRRAARDRPTIADVLTRHGYRTVQVPTHRYFAPPYWQNAGFELALDPPNTKIVPATSALKKGLELARATKQPLLLWVHMMEGHEPYHWKGGHGPGAPSGQRHAFRDLAPEATAFIREFRQIRAGRPAVIVVFGDHGEEFREHGGNFHSTTVYAEQVRTALAISAPGIVDARIDAPVTLASLPATVMDLLGLKAVPSFTEPSLLPCIDARNQCPTVAVSQMLKFGEWIGYTFERYRLLANPEHDIERLFDSTNDPLEQKDLAPTEPALLAELRERAFRFDRANCVSDDE